MVAKTNLVENKKSSTLKDKFLVFFLDNKSIILFIFICILAQIVSNGIFLRGSNLSSVARQVSVNSLMTMGYVVVLTTGMIDLSTGHMLSLCGIVYSQVAMIAPLPIAILATVATGLACGLLNGLLSIKLHLTPLILTLGTQQIFRGVAYLVCDGVSNNVTDPSMQFIGQGILFDFLPMTVVIVTVFIVLMAILMYRTKYGRHVIATGGNIEAARVSGVNTDRVKIMAFVIMGVLISFASLILTGRVAIAMPNAGQGMEMDAIAAAIIGGTALSGGKANVVGAIFGALILGVISNLLNLAGVSSFWQWFFKGVIIIAAILLDSITEAIFKKRQLAS